MRLISSELGAAPLGEIHRAHKHDLTIYRQGLGVGKLNASVDPDRHPSTS